MTWIVRVALDRPYTFLVLAIVILIFGPLAALRTPTDIFPTIGIPVVGVGASIYRPVARRDGGPHGDASSSASCPPTVNDIEHIESQSIAGNGIIKIFFQPGVNIRPPRRR